MKKNRMIGKTEYRAACYQMLRLLGAYLGECAAPSGLPDTDIDALYLVARKSGLRAFTSVALKKFGINSDEFTIAMATALRKSLMFEREMQTISERFHANKIRFFPLKGIVLKSLYPAAALREMSDIDLLIEDRDAAAAQKIMNDLGYETIEFGKSYHDVYHKPPFYGIELHRALFEKALSEKEARYYSEKNFFDSSAGALGTEDQYIYLIAHAYKHYSYYGIGVRTLLDLHFYLNKYRQQMDFRYIEDEIRKIGIAEFEKRIRLLSERLFSIDTLSERETEELDSYIFAGLYGNQRHYVKHRFIRKTEGHKHKRLAYIAKRLKVNDRQIENSRFFSRHPSLSGLMSVTRVGKALVTKPGAVAKEIQEMFRYKKNQDEE